MVIILAVAWQPSVRTPAQPRHFCCGAGRNDSGAVVAEVGRLQLAAEGGEAIGLALRRWRRPFDKLRTEAADFGQPTAATTRWRVTARPSIPLPVPGVGRARWLVELMRCRAGESAQFELEACDARGRLALPCELAHRVKPAVRARM